ncbi:MAG: 6-phosphofructokinase [Planctomycetota bacterium]|nr:6-phosphofructokinase [Planctomycetota bacterium]
MPKSRLGNVLIGQSGGPTAVINQSLVGIVETCRESAQIDRILGAVHGIQGILTGNLVDLGREKPKTLAAVAKTPSSALRSIRKKPTADECREILHKIEALDVHAFFYIGGNDSAETAHLLDEMAREKGWELHLFHVPKTIDNDLLVTDHCPGYGSAAKFVAHAMMGDNEDNRSLPGIKIDVIMGRNAGWLTAASVLARRHEGDGPHLVYVPERDFVMDDFLADVERSYKRLGRCIVAVSEGIHAKGGAQLVVEGEKDSHGNAQLSGTGALGDFLAAEIKAKLGSKLRVRADTFGYLQRCFAGLASDVDAAEAREVGRAAAQAAIKSKQQSGSIAIRRKAKKEYEVAYDVIELSRVAKNTRRLEEQFILGANDIAPAFLDYVSPLVGKLPKTAHLSDFPL